MAWKIVSSVGAAEAPSWTRRGFDLVLNIEGRRSIIVGFA